MAIQLYVFATNIIRIHVRKRYKVKHNKKKQTLKPLSNKLFQLYSLLFEIQLGFCKYCIHLEISLLV